MSKGKYQLIVDKSRWNWNAVEITNSIMNPVSKTLKQKLKRFTKKTIPATFDERITDIDFLMRGWINYFKLASMQ